MKKFLVVLIVILIIPIKVLSLVLFKKYRYGKPIIDNTMELRLQEEKKEKEKELELIKEENKDKIERYEKVKSWNEEITSYFD